MKNSSYYIAPVGVRTHDLPHTVASNMGKVSHALTHSATAAVRPITNLRFADDIDGITGEEDELTELVPNLDTAAAKFGMEISAEKTKIMTNNGTLQRDITIQGQTLETVDQFKYIGAIICDEGSRREVLSRAAQTMAALARLKIIWEDKNIRITHKIRLMRALVMTIFLNACETWTLATELQRRIQSLEFRCFRKILGISYKDRVTNEHVRKTIVKHNRTYEDLLATVKRRKLKWHGHVTRSDGLTKEILQGTVEVSRRRGRPKKSWSDNITEWTGKSFAETQAMAHHRQEWIELTRKSIMTRALRLLTELRDQGKARPTPRHVAGENKYILDLLRGACAVKGNVPVAGHVGKLKEYFSIYHVGPSPNCHRVASIIYKIKKH